MYSVLHHPKIAATAEAYAKTLAKEDRVFKAFAELSAALKELSSDRFCFLGGQELHERRRAHVSVSMHVHNKMLTLALMHPKANIELVARHTPYRLEEIEQAHSAIQQVIQNGQSLDRHFFPGRA